MNRRQPMNAWLKLLIGIFLVAQLSVQAHAIKHDAATDTSCISCTTGGTLSHGAAAPGSPELAPGPSQVATEVRPTLQTADRTYPANRARAPPSML